MVYNNNKFNMWKVLLKFANGELFNLQQQYHLPNRWFLQLRTSGTAYLISRESNSSISTICAVITMLPIIAITSLSVRERSEGWRESNIITTWSAIGFVCILNRSESFYSAQSTHRSSNFSTISLHSSISDDPLPTINSFLSLKIYECDYTSYA